ncbi:D-alanyl-D-alanine carboxypeptidase [Lachnospiraceae bacterium]|nr:D-alanyl-D-alanine carboxypeptidase [Lachnospiraceae bacterium]
MEHAMLLEQEQRNIFSQRTHTGRILLTEAQIYQGNLVLVNQKHPVRHGLSGEELCSVFTEQPEILMEKNSAKMLQKLLKHSEYLFSSQLERDDIQLSRRIVGVSGYRTRSEQVKIFNDSLKENGREFTEKYVAFPDHSEHQTGLAIDLAKEQAEIDFIRPDFPNEGICRRFREQAAEFGFVERYKSEKQKITGIGAEPWHFRYVGKPHAEIMEKTGMALEEYIQWLKQFDLTVHPLTWKHYRIGYLRARGPVTEWKGLAAWPEISGNNADGFIITTAAL